MGGSYKVVVTVSHILRGMARRLNMVCSDIYGSQIFDRADEIRFLLTIADEVLSLLRVVEPPFSTPSGESHDGEAEESER